MGRRKRRSKGRIVVASVNMRGFRMHGEVNQLIRDRKIAVLCLQETHLTLERIESLNVIFGATMKVLGCVDTDNESGARGIAFAINRRVIAEEDLTIAELIPGRAAALTLARILNVYAPNNAADNAAFWSRIEVDIRGGRIRRPDMMVGDFNMVEDSIDRLPPRSDQHAQLETLGRLIAHLGLNDGWRVNNPVERTYTFMQVATGSQSRIDRIYVSDELMSKAEDWETYGPGFPTDHRVVAVSLANYKAPGMGKGRWALPAALLNDNEFLQEDLAAMGERSAERNPQRRLGDAARKRAKVLMPKIDRRIEALEQDIKGRLTEEDPDVASIAILQERLTKLEIKRFDRKRRAVATKDWLHGEAMTRYWTRLNAPQLPSTVINELRNVHECVCQDGECGERPL
ncbi:Endonuclease/exonuclease/phosphatase [Cerioporus squamosus]|nr:Endonuclease/exonuclease/phosphatase [Cerioporus squamosus]